MRDNKPTRYESTLRSRFFGVLTSLAVLIAVGGNSAAALNATVGETETGLAAVYGSKLNGHRTASGAHYNPKALTAAHQTLPFGTKVKVTNVKNNKSVVVRINDRGPTQAGRIVDLSQAAGKAIGISHKSTAEVKIEVVEVAKK